MIGEAVAVVDRYASDVNKHKVLSSKLELELARRFRQGDKHAGQQLVEANLRFAMKVAHEFVRFGHPLEDLIQEANIGLVRALDKFDPKRGYRFITYAVWWIRANLRLYVMRNHSLVRLGGTQRERSYFSSVAATYNKLRQANPTWTEEEVFADVAHTLSLSVEQTVDLHHRVTTKDFSLQTPLGVDADRGAATQQDLLTDQRSPADERLSQAQLISRVRRAAALAARTDRERFVVEKRLLAEEPWGLAEIGLHYGLSRERVRQIEAAVIARIRLVLENKRG